MDSRITAIISPAIRHRVAQGDNFLSIVVPQIMASQAYQNNGLILIWFDETEGGDTSNFTLPFIAISPLAKGNAYQSTLNLSHSSDLRTLQEILQVGGTSAGYLGAAANATDESNLFQAGVILPFLPGDFNRDGHVDAADITAAMAALTDTANYQTGHGLTDPTWFKKVADVNNDGSFNNADLQYLLNTIKSGGGSADPVPEPASGWLVTLAVIVTATAQIAAVRRKGRLSAVQA